MTYAFELRTKIDTFIETMSLNRVDRFYPTALSKYINITPSEAFDFLLERAGAGDQLILTWEARCPDCDRTLNNYNVNTGIECFCEVEDEDEPSIKVLYPVFKINPVYKNFLRREYEKKKKEIQPVNKKCNSKVMI